MNNNEQTKNPLELALEEFTKGKEEIIGARIQIEYLNEELSKKEDQRIDFNRIIEEGVTKIDKTFNDNFSKYERTNEKANHLFNEAITTFVKQFEFTIQHFQGAELSLKEQDRKSLADVSKQMLWQKKLQYFNFGILFFCITISILTGYFANRFYKTSILTKQEARKEVLLQIKDNGDIIVSKDQWSALNNERSMITTWSKSNPNDSKSYEVFRQGIVSAKSKVVLFKNLKDDDIIGSE